MSGLCTLGSAYSDFFPILAGLRQGGLLSPALFAIYAVSQKNDNDVLHYNFNAHQPILIIFGRGIAE